MTTDIPTDDRWRQPLPPITDIECPMCHHKPMQQMDPNTRLTTLSIIGQDRKEFFIDTHVYQCERCWNIQSFIKTLPPT